MLISKTEIVEYYFEGNIFECLPVRKRLDENVRFITKRKKSLENRGFSSKYKAIIKINYIFF
jgi:hypothetical protein